MKEKFWIFSFIFLLILGSLLLLQWRSGLAISEFPEEFQVGDKLSGNLLIEIQNTGDITKQTLILIFLSKEIDIITSQSLSFEEFLLLAEKNSIDIYSLGISKILNYQFTEPGKYEIMFYIPEIDLVVKETFLIK
ncbi:MAG: hypothetical protein KJ718_04970 [Nanoarchaeota archaeon]|nr:hypothetical protein [Nanoarchaeota archaeon]MBU1051877.1 hypothetical protein [Nanoarchaeota archaeon]MBU1988010.1 hypothetical protein [Nanoarchaeota archaeon]